MYALIAIFVVGSPQIVRSNLPLEECQHMAAILELTAITARYRCER